MKSNHKRNWIIASLALIILVIIGYLNLNIVYTSYYYLFKMESFSEGDKMYAINNGNIGLCRLIRPITKDDIDTMQISDTEKLRLQLSLDDSLKPYMINSGDFVSTTENSNYIGTYVKHEFAIFFDNKTKKEVYDNVFVLKPNKNQLTHNDYSAEPMPKGYTWANNTYYVWFPLVSNKETFKTL